MTEYIDRTQEPDEAFTAVLARFDAAPTPPEVLREQVARELWAVDAEVDVDQLSGETPQRFYRLADAAVAVFRGQSHPPLLWATTALHGTGNSPVRAAIGGDER